MNINELDHTIERFTASAERDEALANVLMASSSEKQEMVQTLRQMREEIERLLAQPQVIHQTSIGSVNGTYIETIQQANLCPPSFKTSTERTLSTSTITSTPTITPLTPSE